MTDWAQRWEGLRGVAPRTRRRAFFLGSSFVGYVSSDVIDTLVAAGCRYSERGVRLSDAHALPGFARDLADAGLFAWRDEAFDVRSGPNGPVLTTVDRGALPFFGILAQGVHVNGLVQRPDGLHLWIGRRALDRLMDPGKLDHLVAGGIPAGLTREETLVKEGAEEAGLDEGIMRQARRVESVSYTIFRPEGLRRDWLHCYDLMLSEQVQPTPSDGEVTGFELWPIHRVIETVRDTDDFKFNVNLVLIDLFLRLSLLSPYEEASLRHAMQSG